MGTASHARFRGLDINTQRVELSSRATQGAGFLGSVRWKIRTRFWRFSALLALRGGLATSPTVAEPFPATASKRGRWAVMGDCQKMPIRQEHPAPPETPGWGQAFGGARDAEMGQGSAEPASERHQKEFHLVKHAEIQLPVGKELARDLVSSFGEGMGEEPEKQRAAIHI